MSWRILNFLKPKKSRYFSSEWTELGFFIVVIFLIRTFGFGLYQVPTGSMETTMLVGERFFADKLSYLFVKPKQGDIISFNDPLFPYSKNPLKRLFQEYVWGPSNWTKRLIAVPGQTVKGVIEDGKPVIYVDGKKLDEPYLNKYPLITYYDDNFETLIEKGAQKAAELIQNGRLPRSRFKNSVEEYVCKRSHAKSYDPSVSLDKQPFYRMKKERIVSENGQTDLKEAGTPLKRLAQIPEMHDGKSTWNGTDEFYIELGPNQYWVMGDNRLGSHDSRFIGPIDGRLIHGRIVFRIWSHDGENDWWILDLIKHPIDFWTRMRWDKFAQRVY